MATLRAQIVDIIFGSVFVFIGMAACAVSVIRRRGGLRILLWLGLWSAMYGAMQLTQTPIAIAAAPHGVQTFAPYANTAMTYLVLVAASLVFRELSLGKLRSLVGWVAVMALGIAVAGTVLFVFTGLNDALITYNNLLAATALGFLGVVAAVPKLSAKYLVLPYRAPLAIGTLIFAAEALFVNLVRRPLRLNTPKIFDHLGFAVLLFTFGYAALKWIFDHERRLFAVEDELAIAHEIQSSILPNDVPEIDHLSIRAAYRPMTAVAGDFYEFIPVDEKRVGILIADVSGHGVPAALIASMVKVAVQSVVPCAQSPRAVLQGLNRVLAGQLHSQFVSAAYLWLDTEAQTASYSAAGHPPLLLWREGNLESIESNGLPIGIMLESAEYPVHTMPIHERDRFLLYTDGVTEPANAQGEFFGDHRLEQVVREKCRSTTLELRDALLSEISRWQPAGADQHDDTTLILVDVV